MLGEVPDAAACVVQLRDVLRRGGFLSITELAGDPDAMSEGDIAALAKAANLEHSETMRIRAASLEVVPNLAPPVRRHY